MPLLVVYYSYTGNNRLLAQRLAAKLDCDAVEIVENRPRTAMTILLDIFLRRVPRVSPLGRALEQYQIVFVAPIWAGHIATPLKAVLLNERAAIRDYSFVSLCGGYDKPEQVSRLRDEIARLVGAPARFVFELRIADLFEPAKRRSVRVISGYRVSAATLDQFEAKIDTMVRALTAQ